nr:hypothetical protein [Hymenobacter qilianensis]
MAPQTDKPAIGGADGRRALSLYYPASGIRDGERSSGYTGFL